MAMYCTVHSPIPGSALRRSRKSSVPIACVNCISPLLTACAKPCSVFARDRVNPIRDRSCSAITSGEGKRCVIPLPNSTGRPYARTSLPARVVAPFTVTCCPSTARTESSNPSHAPGTRSPGFNSTCFANSGSAARAADIARGSARRSNSLRIFSTIRNSGRASGKSMLISNASKRRFRLASKKPMFES